MPPTPPRTVVGLDLSLASTGVAVIDRGEIDLYRIKSSGIKGEPLGHRSKRLGYIRNKVWMHVPVGSLVVIEAPALASKTGHMHDRSGLWWLVVHDLIMSSGLEVVEVTPGSLKKYATGKGNAGKDEVLAAVVRRYPDVDVTGNDTADALALAAMGTRHLGHPIDDLPKTNLAAMDAVRWPAVEDAA